MIVIAALVALALLLPPVGIPLLLVLVVARVAAHAGRDGGVVARRQADARIAAEPWWNDVHVET